jgi:hypothetical protein
MPARSVTPRVIMVLILAFQLVGLPLRSQAANTKQGTRDLQSLTTIQNAIAAMGGASHIAAIQTSVVTGNLVIDGDPNKTASFTWEHSGSDFRYEIDAQAGGHTLVSNGGIPQDVRGSLVVDASFQQPRGTLPFHIPAVVLLAELNNPNYSLSFVETTILNGTPAVHIHTADNSDDLGKLVTQQDWYFDATTFLPLRASFMVLGPNDPNDWLQETMDFSNWQTVNGVQAAFQLALQIGPKSAVATISSVGFNVTIDPSDFQAPAGGGQ